MFSDSERLRWLAVITLTGLIAAASAARGADKEPPPPTNRELGQRIKELEDIIKNRPPAAAPAPQPGSAERAELEQIIDDRMKKQKVLAGWQDGFYVNSADGDFKLKLRGLVQLDPRFFPVEDGDTGTDSFTLRRLRPILEGTVYKYVDFKLMPDFGEGKTVLQDGYLEFKYWNQARLRAGKFKTPFSLERLQSASDLIFVERAISQNLAPNRDLGLQLAGDFLGGALSYQAGAFNGNVDGGSNDGDTGSDKDFAARLFTQPFIQTDWNPVKNLGFGAAGTFGKRDKESPSSLAFKTAGRSTFFKYDSKVIGKGDQRRFSPQGYYFWGPFGLMGEYIFSEQQDTSLTIPAVKVKGKPTIPAKSFLGDVANDGWFVQASYVLTGENASYKGVVPINSFDPRAGRWGAFEVAGRYSEVNVDDDAFRLKFADPKAVVQNAAAYTGGVNWYLNKAVKIQLNYEHTDFDREVPFANKKKRDHEGVVLARFQLAF